MQIDMLDAMMPDMDGPATLNALRCIEALAATPVVFVTAKTQAFEVRRFREFGAADVITKPFKSMELPDRLRELWRALP